MTDQNTPELDAAAAPSADGGEPTTARPRRRRASRPAAPPEAVTAAEATAPEATAPEAGAPAGPDEAAAPAEKPAKPRRARTTRAKAAPAEKAAAEDSATADAAVAADEKPADTAADEAPAMPARRRRAATRPVATPVPQDLETSVDTPAETPAGTPAAAAEATTVEPPAADDEAPAKPARRRSRRAAAPEPVAPVEEPAADEDEDATEEEAAEEATATDEAGEPVETPAEKAPTAPTAPVAPRLATTALLFQAPDISQARPRRRRATSSAGSPEEISQSARQAAEDAPTLEDASSDTAVQAEETPAEQQATERPSRRRGRRGRGSRAETTEGVEETTATAGDAPEEPAADDAVVAPDEADDAVAQDADAQGEDAQGEDAQDEDAQGDGAEGTSTQRRRRRRGGRGRRRSESTERDEDEPAAEAPADGEATANDDAEGDESDEEPGEGGSSRRRRRRRRGSRSSEGEGGESRRRGDEVTALRGSTRLEAKRQRRREGRDAGRRRQIITEAEFLARRESVERSMIVREKGGRTQIAVLEDGVLVEHYVSNQAQASMVGNVYLGRVQNVLPSMEAAFVDVGKGRNAVLYAGEVNWDAAGLEGQPRRIETALKSGDSVLVQVTKDPIGHKGARLTSQITLAGRYLVFVPGAGMTGISRKLPEKERARLKKLLREIVPENSGVIVRTAAEGASEEELRADIARLTEQWAKIEKKAKTASAPALLQGEADLAIRVVRDIFNDDFASLVVQGKEAWDTISGYVSDLAPDLSSKLSRWTSEKDVFAEHRIDEQIAKAMDRKVWLPSGGSLVIDRTEAMTVIDVNTGKFTGTGGTLEETVTRNNLEAAEEIVRQLRLRDIGGIIVIDFIDMVLESNRDLVLRRLVECLGRDRTKHQVAEVTSLGLVQMTRKRVGQGLLEAFSETCDHCAGRGYIVHDHPVDKGGQPQAEESAEPKKARRSRKAAAAKEPAPHVPVPVLPAERDKVNQTLATIAAAAAHAHEHDAELASAASADAPVEVEAPAEAVETLVTEPLAEVDEGTRDESVEPSEGEPEES